MNISERLNRLGLLLIIPLICSCGGGSGEGSGSPGGTAPLLSIDTRSLETVVNSTTVYLRGDILDCPGCPPATSGFGYCPTISCPTDVIPIAWTNSATNESGAGNGGFANYCSCLFSQCVSTCAGKWGASVPVALGSNTITVRKSEGTGSGDSVTITRILQSPTDVSASAENKFITVSWNSVPDAESYNLYWSISKDITKDTAEIIPGVTSPYTVAGLPESEIYSFLVTALNGDSESLASNVAQVKAAISEPSDLVSILSLNGTVKLSWVASTSTFDLGGYRILRNGIDYANVQLASYTDTAVKPDTRYCYTVLAYDYAGNESLLSNESCINTEWRVSVIDDHGGEFSDITVGPSRNVHIAYASLKYAVTADNGWDITTVDTSYGVKRWPSMAIDSNGFAHIIYANTEIISNSLFEELKYANNVSGAWTTEVTGTGGWYTSLAMDSQDYLHVGYGHFYWSQLDYANNKTGTWESVAVTAADEWISIAVDTTDNIHLSSYQSYPENDLLYSTNRTGEWVTEPVDTDYAGEHNSLVIDANGDAHISYCGYFSGLHYASNTSGAWSSVMLDDGGCVNTSLALDTVGNIHISYHDGRYIKYVSNKTGSWQIDTIDEGETPEYYSNPTAIAVDDNNDVHISYCATGYRLGYATTR